MERVLDLFDSKRKLILSSDDISRLLIKANLLVVLTDLIPNLVNHADN